MLADPAAFAEQSLHKLLSHRSKKELENIPWQSARFVPVIRP